MTEFVVDERFASRAVLAALRWPRPIVVVLYLYFPLMVVIGIVEFATGADGWSFVIGGLVVAIALPAIAYGRSVALIRRQVPVGSTMRAEFGPEEFTVERAGSRLTLSYDQVRRARRIGDFVLYRNIANLTVVLPGSLVTDADLRRFPRQDGS